MPHTDRYSVVGLAIKALVNANKEELGIENVYYGDHNNIPDSVSVVVQPIPKTRELAGVGGPGGRSMNTMRFYVWVHNSKLGSEEEERLRVDQIAEEVEALLHNDVTLDGIIIHGFVEEMDPGITKFDNSQYRTVQMRYKAISKTQITLV